MKNTLKKMFEGRLNRRNFIKGFMLPWLSVVAIFVSYFVLQIVETVLGVELDVGFMPYLFVVVGLLALVFLLISNPPSLIIRRHHDLNQPWAYPLVIIVILFVLTIVFRDLAEILFSVYYLYLLLAVGSKGKNNYGDEDKPRGLKSIFGLQK